VIELRELELLERDIQAMKSLCPGLLFDFALKLESLAQAAKAQGNPIVFV
jgi:hypothetical protein